MTAPPRGGIARRRLLPYLVIPVVLTLASSVVPGTRYEVQDWDCPPGASCERPVHVRGFPVSYISDYHGISVVGSADLVGALLGEDIFRWPGFFIDVAIYALLIAAVRGVLRLVGGARSQKA